MSALVSLSRRETSPITITLRFGQHTLSLFCVGDWCAGPRQEAGTKGSRQTGTPTLADHRRLPWPATKRNRKPGHQRPKWSGPMTQTPAEPNRDTRPGFPPLRSRRFEPRRASGHPQRAATLIYCNTHRLRQSVTLKPARRKSEEWVSPWIPLDPPLSSLIFPLIFKLASMKTEEWGSPWIFSPLIFRVGHGRAAGIHRRRQHMDEPAPEQPDWRAALVHVNTRHSDL